MEGSPPLDPDPADTDLALSSEGPSSEGPSSEGPSSVGPPEPELGPLDERQWRRQRLLAALAQARAVRANGASRLVAARRRGR